MDQDFFPMPPEGEPIDDTPAPANPSTGSSSGRGRGLKTAAIGSIVAGGLAVAAIVGPLSASAASPSPTAATAPTPTGEPPVTDGGHGWGPGGFNPNEVVSDTSVVATAIGISEADLKTALEAGDTVATVAKAHSVDPQVVIDALVKDGLDELAARVTAGTLTQAQADAEKAEVTQRATDQVNGTFTGGRGGHGWGPGGFNPNETVSDTSVVATAIGISEADLKTALAAGDTVATVAKAHNVDTQVVIDALTKDGLDELAAQVTAGTLTQAQADAEKAEVTQRATDQVNGTFTGGRGGHGWGPSGPGERARRRPRADRLPEHRGVGDPRSPPQTTSRPAGPASAGRGREPDRYSSRMTVRPRAWASASTYPAAPIAGSASWSGDSSPSSARPGPAQQPERAAVRGQAVQDPLQVVALHGHEPLADVHRDGAVRFRVDREVRLAPVADAHRPLRNTLPGRSGAGERERGQSQRRHHAPAQQPADAAPFAAHGLHVRQRVQVRHREAQVPHRPDDPAALHEEGAVAGHARDDHLLGVDRVGVVEPGDEQPAVQAPEQVLHRRVARVHHHVRGERPVRVRRREPVAG